MPLAHIQAVLSNGDAEQLDKTIKVLPGTMTQIPCEESQDPKSKLQLCRVMEVRKDQDGMALYVCTQKGNRKIPVRGFEGITGPLHKVRQLHGVLV